MLEPVMPLVSASSHVASPEPNWDALVVGKLIELSGQQGSARTSTAAQLVRWAQDRGDGVAWVQPAEGRLYPPDLHATGVDLNALLVAQLPRQAGAFGVPKAAEILLRSGAFGLVVLDLLAGAPPAGEAWQGRLLALARQHQATVVALTHKAAAMPSLGALCSWRLEPRCRKHPSGVYWLEQTVLKNKVGAPWPNVPLMRRGPAGVW